MSFIRQVENTLAQPGLRAHAVRFAALTAGSLAAQLATLGTGHLDGKVVAAMLLGAVVAAYRQWTATAQTAPAPAPAAQASAPAAQPSAPAAGDGEVA
jgi:hypothetical protein